MRARRLGAPRSLLNLVSMLAVIAGALAAIIVSGAHLGREFGLLNANWGQSTSVNASQFGTAGITVPSIHQRSAMEHANLPDLAFLAPSPSPSPSPSAIATALPQLTPSPVIISRPALHTGTWVPILMYHYIRASPDKAGVPLSVLPPDFEAQMHYLKDHGYHTVTVRDLDLALLGQASLPPNPVALTFDDGYQDFYSTAVPIMRPLGITATDYVPTMLIGRPNYMTWDEVRVLDLEGYEMAAHSQFHVDVSRVSPARAQIEIQGAKADLERHLGHQVVDWAYPYGGFNFATIQLVRDAGYLSGATTRPGGWHDVAQMPMLTRVRVGGGESLQAFARSLHP